MKLECTATTQSTTTDRHQTHWTMEERLRAVQLRDECLSTRRVLLVSIVSDCFTPGMTSKSGPRSAIHEHHTERKDKRHASSRLTLWTETRSSLGASLWLVMGFMEVQWQICFISSSQLNKIPTFTRQYCPSVASWHAKLNRNICFDQLSVKILFLHSLKWCDDRRLINHSSLVNLHPGLLSPVSCMVTVLLRALLFCSVKVGKRQTAGLRCMKFNHGKSNKVYQCLGKPKYSLLRSSLVWSWEKSSGRSFGN